MDDSQTEHFNIFHYFSYEESSDGHIAYRIDLSFSAYAVLYDLA